MRPPVVPDHTLICPIGRGAYGEVWLAQNVMGTARAIKVIWRYQFESARPFEREFDGIRRYEPVSRTSGGLVHVLHVGRNDAQGYFYYVMELADDAGESAIPHSQEAPRRLGNLSGPDLPGSSEPSARHSAEPIRGTDGEVPVLSSYRPRTLRSDLQRGTWLSMAECLRLATDLAGGLGELHRHGLVHRDVKPGNIIYVNGRAKLADIGLVTAEGEGRTFVGTEGYVPPEGPGSPAADLFGLGIVLYEASTGFPPESFPDVPPEWFTSSDGRQALEFYEIILRSCEGQRERRYKDADTLQADLALLQSGQSVRRMRALQRRYARLRMTGVVGTACLVVALGLAFLANDRARVAAEGRAKEARLRQQAQQAQAQAERAEREAHRQYQEALYEKARVLVLSKKLGHRVQALEAVALAKGSTNAAELRRVAFAALALPDLRLERQVALPSALTIASVDADLKQIALLKGRESVEILSIPAAQVLATLPNTGTNEAYVTRWSPDGRLLAVKREYGNLEGRSDLEVWDVRRGQLSFLARSDFAYNSFSFHPKRPLLITGHTGGILTVWDLQSGREQRAWTLPGTPNSLAYSPDGQRVAASYQSGSNWVVDIHDAASGVVLSAAQSAEPASEIVWDPRGRWISTLGQSPSDWGRGVRLIDAQSGAIILLGRHKIFTSGISFSPDGNYLVSCGWERESIWWDLRTLQPAFTCTDTGYELAWGRDGSHYAMVPRSKRSLQLFTFERPACLELSGNHGERLRPGAFSPDGRWLALPEDQDLCVWDLTSSSPPVLLAEKVICPPFFSADSSELFAVAGPGGAARLKAWQIDCRTGAANRPSFRPLPVAECQGLTWAGLAGQAVILTGEEGVRLVALTNLANGEGRFLPTVTGPGAISPGGRWLAVTHSYSPLVTVYGLPDLDKVAQLNTADLVGSVWFSTGGDELTVINRGGLEMWDTRTWRPIKREPGSPVSDSYVLYSPNGRGLWRVTAFRDAALCARSNLEPLLPLPENVLPLALNSDGSRLVVSVDDQRVQVWDWPKLRSQFRNLGLDWQSP